MLKLAAQSCIDLIGGTTEALWVSACSQTLTCFLKTICNKTNAIGSVHKLYAAEQNSEPKPRGSAGGIGGSYSGGNIHMNSIRFMSD